MAGQKVSFLTGYLLSLIGHLLLAVVAIFVLESGTADAHLRQEVFTVTLEGGESLGGISQVPKKGSEKKIPKIKNVAKLEAPESTQDKTIEETSKATKKLEAPSVVEDPEKLLEEERKKKEAEKKKKKEQEEAKKRKRAEEKKRKAAEEKKRKAEEAKKKKAEAERKRKEELKRRAEERKKRDRALRERIKAVRDGYDGESANAGGEGFGAASLGGKGMGGGTLQSLEFIAYRNELEAHIKSRWHWLAGNQKLRAQVLVQIQTSGEIKAARITRSSGNGNFDESVLRAVYKSSPVPAPPSRLYQQFREVRMTFDSQE